MSKSVCTPQTAAHQAPPSLGFSRQEYWSGLPFPSPVHACMLSRCSRVWLCATIWTAAPQSPPSTGFSSQEHWSGYSISIFPEKFSSCYTFLFQKCLISVPHILSQTIWKFSYMEEILDFWNGLKWVTAGAAILTVGQNEWLWQAPNHLGPQFIHLKKMEWDKMISILPSSLTFCPCEKS